MKNNIFETILGAVVIITAGYFLFFASQKANIKPTSNSYSVSAKFTSVDGIAPGFDVKIAGVKIGQVTNITLDKDTFMAKLTMAIDNEFELPIDTVAKITSEGLLGGKYLALEAGGEDLMLEDGDEIEYTQSAANLEDLIGRFIFSSNSETAQAEE